MSQIKSNNKKQKPLKMKIIICDQCKKDIPNNDFIEFGSTTESGLFYRNNLKEDGVLRRLTLDNYTSIHFCSVICFSMFFTHPIKRKK